MPRKFIASRWGRAAFLNGDDEWLHIVDASITPSDGLDVDASGAGGVTFGLVFRRNPLSLGTRQVLMGKRDDATTSNLAGWYLELTADDTLRAFLDDGTNTVEVESSAVFAADDHWHLALVTVDFDGSTISLWGSRGKDIGEPTELATGSLGSVGDCTNAEAFTLGALYDGAAAATHANVAVDWAGYWDEVLPDDYIKGPVSRFQLADPYDRRVVSLWHFTQQDGDDWNRVNANDLTANGLASANYIYGQERFLDLDDFSITPQLADKGSSLDINTQFFRPAVLQEGHFRYVGSLPAPALRIMRSNTSSPRFVLGQVGSASIVGPYALAADSDSPDGTLFLFAADIDEQFEGVAAWGVLDSVGTFGNDISEADGDIPGGVPDYVFLVRGTGAGTGELVVLDVTDPTNISVAGTEAGAGNPDTTTMALYDARDNGYVWVKSQSSVLGFDASTRTNPAAPVSVSDSKMDGTTQRFVQVGSYLFVCADLGIAVVDISTPASPTFVDRFGIDQDGDTFADTDASVIAVLDDSNFLATVEIESATLGWLRIWDIGTPTSPEVVASLQFTRPGSGGAMFRLYRYGQALYMYEDADADQRVAIFNVADPLNPKHMADWDLSDYVPDTNGAHTDYAQNGRHVLITGNSAGPDGGFYLGKIDDDEGFSALQVDYDVTGGVVQNPKPTYEIYELFHDLSDLDFETDADGTDPPNGWTQNGSGTTEVDDAEGLSGASPGAGVPQSVKMNTSTTVQLQRDATPSLTAGEPVMLEAWVLVRGTATLSASDFNIQIVERDGSGDVSTTTQELSADQVVKDRWHRLEVVVWVSTEDVTTIRVQINWEGDSALDAYVDAVRVGRGRVPLLFAGRVIAPTGNGAQPGCYHAHNYRVQMVDWGWDFNRLDLDEQEISGAEAETTLPTVISANTRSLDGFTTVNVEAELGAHEEIDVKNGDRLGTIVNRIVEQADGYWYLDFFRDVHALPHGYEVAAVAINDVEGVQSWVPRSLRDAEDGADLVTEGTVDGDQSKSNRPSASFTDDAAESRYGKRKKRFDPDGDVKTASQATSQADYYKSLLADRQRTLRVVFYDEVRIRPGMLVPVQIDNRGWDAVGLVGRVQYQPDTDGARLLTAVEIGLLQEDFLDVMLRAREDAANQRGKRQVPEDVRDIDFWTAGE